MTRTGTTQAAEPTVALGGLPSPASFMVATSGAGRGDHAATLKAVKVASTGKRRRVKGRPNQALRGNVVDKPEANVEDHPFAHDLAAEGNAQGPRRRMTMVPALLAVVGSLARTSPPRDKSREERPAKDKSPRREPTGNGRQGSKAASGGGSEATSNGAAAPSGSLESSSSSGAAVEGTVSA
ncbi:hypothetical protein MRX96_004013 [Rhipicephalus microplus]